MKFDYSAHCPSCGDSGAIKGNGKILDVYPPILVCGCGHDWPAPQETPRCSQALADLDRAIISLSQKETEITNLKDEAALWEERYHGEEEHWRAQVSYLEDEKALAEEWEETVIMAQEWIERCPRNRSPIKGLSMRKGLIRILNGESIDLRKVDLKSVTSRDVTPSQDPSPTSP